MKTYLVGGAVRDQLLGHPYHERDWVVVGATPEQMLANGFQQVGADFPVFLHPQTHEEYALARTERKQGHGYTGFTVHAATDVTLEQDLLRRDLTINAIARDEDGNLIDPYHGQRDLEQRVLRHVSPAFAEDPLRVLRVARFAARYRQYGFTIAPETQHLMQQLAHAGELAHLTPERVWKETSRALSGAMPHIYFQTLRDCGALAALFPELDALFGVPNPAQWHPEIDTGIHTLMVLQQASMLSAELPVRFAALVHDLGKAKTPLDKWPSHRGHEQLGLSPVRQLCQRLRVPNPCTELALLVTEFHGHIHRAKELRPQTLLKLFNQCDVWRRPERFAGLLLACEADARGRTGYEQHPYPQADYVRQALTAAQQVDVKAIVAAGYQGAAIREQLEQQRLTAITRVKGELIP